MKSNKYLFIFLLAILTISLISAISINQISPTTSPFITPNSSILLDFNFTTDYLNNLTFNWDNTNYSIYDPSLVLFMNFDNRSALGENDTVVKDLSMYGNNGTVLSGYIWYPNNGKYNGAFNFTGSAGRINISNKNLILENTPITFCSWFKSTGGSAGRLIDNGKYLIIVSATAGITIQINGGTLVQNVFTTLGTYTHICSVSNSTGFTYLYNNGILVNSSNTNVTINGTTELNIGNRGAGDRGFIGYIDEVMIFNRTLSSGEVSQLYKSQLTKYDLQNWSFITNQTLTNISWINSTNPSDDFNYQLCSSNLTNQVCSNLNTIQETISKQTITTNFSNSIGNIRSDFYGAHIGNDNYLSYTSLGIPPTYNYFVDSTVDRMRTQWLDTKMSMIRVYPAFNAISLSEGVFNSNASQQHTRLVAWAKANNQKILFNMYGTPNWLANKTNNYCTTANNITCTPTDYGKMANVTVDFLNNISCDANTCIIEVGNEPDSSLFWLNNLSESNGNSSIRSIEYNKLYNATYLAVKSAYPTMQVGGMGNTAKTTRTFILMDNWFGNFSNKIDFVSQHAYLGLEVDGFTNFNQMLSNYYSWLQTNMTAYNVNTSRIILSEYNVNSQNTRINLTSQWGMQMALVYEVTLNSNPVNISLLQYEFGGYDKYNMINTTGTNVFASYNVTKSFATYCPAGSTVYQSTSDDSTIKTVTCKDGNKYNIIIINTDTVSKNVSLSQVPVFQGRLRDTETGSLYSVQTGEIELGIRDSYDIRYLTTDVLPHGYTLNADGVTFDITGEENACQSSLSAFVSYIALLGLLGVVIFFGWLFAYLFGMVDTQKFKDVAIIGSVTTLILLGVLLIVAIVIFSSLCSIF